MDDAVILGSAPPSDAGISDGKVLIGSQTLDNSIPVSGAYEGPINVSLEFFEHEPISVQARRLKVLRLGTPEYVEDVNF
jgi:hypothetical protein